VLLNAGKAFGDTPFCLKKCRHRRRGKEFLKMAEEMTKIEIVTRQSMLEPLKDALNDIGINGMTVYNVLGYGVQKGQKHKYRGVDYSVDLLPKIKIEMVVCTVPVDDVVNTALSVLRTGEIGDGKIFISPVQKVIKVRTGETDKAALL
jgi:nitrogen regulatory protein PII